MRGIWCVAWRGRQRDPPPGAGPVTSSAPRRAAVKAVACFEAFKGVVVLAAGSGLLLLIHRDVHAVAATLVEHLHLDPASRYPRIFLDAAAGVHGTGLVWLALGAGAYALLRFVEAWGLFGEKAWAEMLAAASGALYVPFELTELVRRPTWHGGWLLAVNLLVVGLMVAALRRRRQQRGSAGCSQ